MSVLETSGGEVLAVEPDHVGIVPNLNERLYHSHPALSSTGARQLLDSPARFDHERRNPRADTKAFDVGTAAHSKVLGVGAGIAVYPDGTGDEFFDDPESETGDPVRNVLSSNGAASTAVAKRFEQATRAAGLIPVKRAESEAVDRMAEAVLANAKARLIFEQPGIPEASVFSTDPDTGVSVRCRFDFLGTGPGRRVAGDLKTARDSSRRAFIKAVAEHGYHIQEAHYGDTLRFADGHYDLFTFVVVQKDPPHIVRTYVLGPVTRDIARDEAAHARRLFAHHTQTGVWRDEESIDLIELPTYAIYEHEERFKKGIWK